MRLLPKFSIAVCIACILFPNPGLEMLHSQTTRKHLPHASNEAIGKAIQDLEAQLRIAYLKADSGWLEQRLSDAYIELDENGTLKTRTDLIQAFRTANLAYDVVNLSEGSARIFNGDAV
ncbi:MAG: nuclear transport factor 2 family protein, partial [Candidatus Angelobacter sp.]